MQETHLHERTHVEHRQEADGPGDRQALNELLERETPFVRAMIARRIPRRLRTVLTEDDIMQQTLADVAFQLDRFVSRGPGSFRAWMIWLAKCNLADALYELRATRRAGSLRRFRLAG